MKTFILLLSFVVISSNFTNPVVDVDAPDPGIFFFENFYYIVNTGTDGKGGYYPIRKSQDLVHWELIGTVFNETTKPSYAIDSFWAPELHSVNGGINVYFSVKHTNNTFVIGGAKSKTGKPEGPYETFREPLVHNPMGAIDASFIHEEGTKNIYLIYKVDGNAFGRPTPIFIAQLNYDGTRIIGNHIEILTNDQPWEGKLVEGPWIHFHNGYYFLFYSGQGYSSAGYAVGVARSKNITGPYEKAAAPILSQVANKAQGHYFTGPGHNSVIHVPESNADVMVYHSWLNGKIKSNPGRVISIDKICWTKDDWPVVGIAGTPSHQSLPEPKSKEFGDMQMDVRLKIGSVVALGTYQSKEKCWNSNDSSINGNCEDKKNFYKVREGLAGYGTITLESVSKPGYYWRHEYGKMELHQDDGTELFKKDSSFIAVGGFQDQSMLSLRPVNYPFNCIRQKNGQLVQDLWTDSNMFGEDGTWRVYEKNSDEMKMLTE